MRSRAIVLCSVFAGLMLLGAVGSAWILHRATVAKRRVAWVPPIPDLKRWPEEFARQVREANAAAYAQTSVATLTKLADLYQANGITGPTRIVLNGLRALEPRNPRWAYRLADVEMRSGNAASAEDALVTVTNLESDYAQAWLRLGYLLTERQALREAQDCYAHAVAVAPGDIRVAYLQLAFQARYGDHRLILNRLETLARSRPEIREIQKLRAEMCIALGDAVGAAEAKRHAAAAKFNLSSEDPWIDEFVEFCFDSQRLSLLASEAAGEQRYDVAVRLLSRAIELAPVDASLRALLAGVFDQMGRPDQAYEMLAKGVAELPEAIDLRVQFARFLCSNGRAEEAIALLQPARSRHPENAALMAALGYALRCSGQNASALPILQAALRGDPNQVETQYELGACLLALERRSEARTAAELALAMRPDYHEALVLLAGMAIEAEDTVAAAGPVDRLQIVYPDDPVTQVLYGTFQLLKGVEAEQAGKIPEAIAFNRSGRDAAPTYAPLMRQAGIFFMRHGQIADAVTAYERLIGLTPSDPSAYYLLADALQGSGRDEEARAILERGLIAAKEMGDQVSIAKFARRLGR